MLNTTPIPAGYRVATAMVNEVYFVIYIRWHKGPAQWRPHESHRDAYQRASKIIVLNGGEVVRDL